MVRKTMAENVQMKDFNKNDSKVREDVSKKGTDITFKSYVVMRMAG